MGFARDKGFGRSMGRVQGLGSLSIIITSAVLYILYKFFKPSYQSVFIAAACAMILAGFLFLFIRNEQKIVSEKRFIFRREYKLYYVMSVVNGARKQITLTFVPWLIIDIYAQPVTTITILFFIVCVINIFFKPWFGGLIDKRGEKFAMQFEAVIMFIACIGFIFADTLFTFKTALVIAGICYVMDKLMESASMARATYVKKLSATPPKSPEPYRWVRAWII
jgi:MFS family permease